MGEDGAESIDGVDVLKYLGRLLERSDDGCPEVLRKNRKVRQVWGCQWKFMRRKGADTFISEKLYCTVVQAVLLFGMETWVLSAKM